MRNLVIALITISLCAPARAEDAGNDPLWNGLFVRSPWVFLGDSNTFSGGYVAILDAWLEQAGVEGRPKLLNLGVSSETASGLSEVDHPFKRPCVHERLDKVLTMTKPGVVFICYGMNDGIYQPFNEEVFTAYQAGMLKLAQAVRASGAKLVCLTPPVFEPEPVAAKGKIGPTPEGRYAYFAPAKNYDYVLQRQASWCLSNQIQADVVIDIRTLLLEEKKSRQDVDPQFSFSGDGVHFGNEAHGLIAESILNGIHAPKSLVQSYPDNAQIGQAKEKMQILRNAYLSATGKNRPGLPAGLPVWYAEQLVSRLDAK